MTDEEFAAFVDARFPALARFGALLAGDPGRGEDLAQSALMRAYPRRASIADAPEAYVRQVMARLAARSARRRWWGERPTAVLPDVPDDDVIGRFADAEAVWSALRRLPDGQRVVLVMRYWADLSEAEIAAQLGCSAGTVKSRAARALAALRGDPSLHPDPVSHPSPQPAASPRSTR
ncbi:MAG: SigE family RNA polymerase sigma factor [Kineosporiaceae bacterium]